MAAVPISETTFIDDANLQGYWGQESNGGDSGPNGYTLTETGSPIHSAGKFGNGVTFVQASKYQSIADASCPNLEMSGSFTVSVWAKPTNTAGSWATGYMLSKRLFTPDRGYYLALSGGVNPIFYAAGLTTNVQVVSTGAVANGNWYHIVGVYDSVNTKLKIFLDSVKTEVTASGAITDSNSIFYIGLNSNNTAEGFDGEIDDVAVFNRALTDAEVLSIYNGSAAKATSGFFMLL